MHPLCTGSHFASQPACSYLYPSYLLQAGEPYTALEVFRQIQQAGLTPNFITYSGLISALGKVRRRGQPSAELAYQLWQELYQLQQPLDAAAFRAGRLPLLYHFLYPVQSSSRCLTQSAAAWTPAVPCSVMLEGCCALSQISVHFSRHCGV